MYSSSQGCHTATGTHMPHGITQCYLPPDRGDIPALTPAEAGTRFIDPGGMKGWVDLVTIDSVTSLHPTSHVPHKGFNVFYSTVVYGELALLAVSNDAVTRPSGLVRVLLKTRSQSVVEWNIRMKYANRRGLRANRCRRSGADVVFPRGRQEIACHVSWQCRK